MNILVTGGTGFIGTHLIERLKAQGHRIVCISKERLHQAFLESLQVDVILGDLNNGIAWERVLPEIDCIYHLAGVTRARITDEYYTGNYIATKNLLRGILPFSTNLKRFVYVSSLTAVGPSFNGVPVNERTPYHPVSHYGKSKMMAEQEVIRYSDMLPITILRPSAVYGPRERDMYEYFKLILKKVQLLIGFKNKFLNLIHVDDLVDGIVRAGENIGSAGKIYFLGSKRPYLVEEIGNAISKAIGNCPIKIHLPHAIVYGYGAVGELIGRITGRRVFFNLQKVREGIQTMWDCSIKKASAELGFLPKLSLEQGMLQTYEWYKKENWL
jgi:nucleoside-diphosphate-sugar epimerase